MAESQGGVRFAEDGIIAQLLPESRAVNGAYVEEEAEEVKYSDTEEDIGEDEQGRELGELPAEGLAAADRWEDACTGCPRSCCALLASVTAGVCSRHREAGLAAAFGVEAALGMQRSRQTCSGVNAAVRCNLPALRRANTAQEFAGGKQAAAAIGEGS